ncbi:Uncharacterised protein [Lysinibacillus capsici]|uniref:Uncharacterized protein n=1 Tax=Lysinibacillus capsici TaxID=2115968 RepID=A0A2X1A922_9BACI|nr:hypothetical protein [Lysinibacillus capsici]SPU40647.1 Uncharacterised protein [Lysinibacillus capsici]
MSKPIVVMFGMVVGYFFLFASLAYTVYLGTDVKDAFDDIPTTQTVYNVQTKIPEEVLWTGSQLVGKLYRLTEEDYPIQVGSLVFSTDADVEKYQHFISLTSSYKSKVILDNEGTPTKLVFEIQ